MQLILFVRLTQQVLVVEREVVTVLQVSEQQVIHLPLVLLKEIQEEVHLEVHLTQDLVEVVEQALQVRMVQV